MLVKKLFKINRLCILNDAAQVLESGERVLLGVQHLLGRFLHVPVRLLGEHPAAAAVSGPGPARSRRRRVERVGGEETSARDSFTPQPCGAPGQPTPPRPRPGPPPPARLAPRLPGAFGSGPNMADPFSSRARSWGDLGRPPPPPPASCGRRSPPQAGPGPEPRGWGARRQQHGSSLPEAPLRLKRL